MADMSQVYMRRSGTSATADACPDWVAKAYNEAADTYRAYADGDPQRLFSFDGPHGFADGQVWSVLAEKLRGLHATGATSVNILDAGCGPGTWLRRIAHYASVLGFRSITARGFDVAETQIEAANSMARELRGISGLQLSFDVADLQRPLPEKDRSVDITLCLYSVLSHLPRAHLPQVASEIARVTRGHFIATVRSIGSTPTVFVDTIESARQIMLDHDRDQCDIELRDGRQFTLPFHLFSPSELRRVFMRHFEIEDLLGLDIFHGRFSLDRRWNPAPCSFDPRSARLLAVLEDQYARHPSLMERATHLMLVGCCRPPSKSLRFRALAGEREQDNQRPCMDRTGHDAAAMRKRTLVS
jgi:SAM-dependent methyltransferase